MGHISVDADLEFLKKGLALFQEEEIVLKSQIEGLEAEIDDIKRLILQRPELLEGHNQLQRNIKNSFPEAHKGICKNEDFPELEKSVDFDEIDSVEESPESSCKLGKLPKIYSSSRQAKRSKVLSYPLSKKLKSKTINCNDVATSMCLQKIEISHDTKSPKKCFCSSETFDGADERFLNKLEQREFIRPDHSLKLNKLEQVMLIQNDYFENIDSASQQNSVSSTSANQVSRLPSQSKLATYLPKCLQKNYLKCKVFPKRVKSKKQTKQKSFERKNVTPHKYTTRTAVRQLESSRAPVVPTFLRNKTELNSDEKSKQSSSDSEDEIALLPDLDDSIFEEFSELDDETVRTKSTFQLFRTLPDTIPKVVTKNLQAISNCRLEEDIEKCIEELKDYISPDNIRNLIFYILRFLPVVSKNPVIVYKNLQEPSSLVPVEDSCIAYIFVGIDDRLKLQNTGFLLTVLVNMRLLILGMDTMPIEGLCAFCRVFTKICKLKNNGKEPISLCCDILKMKHKFAPMLVASIAVVWKELFDVSYEAPEEVTTFYGSISLAARKWPNVVSGGAGKAGLTLEEWETSRLLIKHYVSASPVYPSEDTINFLFNSIEDEGMKESSEEVSMLIKALLIFASYKTWSWVKEKIVDMYLIPKIKKHSYSANDVHSLTLYCKLYGEICSFNTCDIFKPEKFLLKLFRSGCEDREYKFLQEASATALLELLLSTKKPLPNCLEEWIQENENNPKFIAIKLIRHRYRFRNKMDFTAENILC